MRSEKWEVRRQKSEAGRQKNRSQKPEEKHGIEYHITGDAPEMIVL